MRLGDRYINGLWYSDVQNRFFKIYLTSKAETCVKASSGRCRFEFIQIMILGGRMGWGLFQHRNLKTLLKNHVTRKAERCVKVSSGNVQLLFSSPKPKV